MDDLVIGAITRYKFEHIKYWVNSLNRSGFKGIKLLLAYDIDQDTIKELNKNDIQVALVPVKTDNIVVDRFYHYWTVLRQIQSEFNQKFRYIVATDVRDVIFQQDPIIDLEHQLQSVFYKATATSEKQFPHKILLSSEGIRYKHESWGDQNLKYSFGADVHLAYRDNIIVNCGAYGGICEYMMDLFLSIALLSQASPYKHVPGGGGPDQAALNILMSMNAWKDVAVVSSNWAAQLGTTADPNKINTYRPYLTSKEPIWDATRFEYIHPVSLQSYPIVHQWDRMGPEITQKIMEKYS